MTTTQLPTRYAPGAWQVPLLYDTTPGPTRRLVVVRHDTAVATATSVPLPVAPSPVRLSAAA